MILPLVHDDVAHALSAQAAPQDISDAVAGERLLRIIDNISETGGVVPGADIFAADLAPLEFVNCHQYSRVALLKTAIAQHPDLGLQWLRAAVRSGNAVFFRRLSEAGADVSVGKGPVEDADAYDGNDFVNNAMDLVAATDPRVPLLAIAIAAQQPDMLPVILADPSLVVGKVMICRVVHVAREHVDECPPAVMVECVTKLLSVPRFVDELTKLTNGLQFEVEWLAAVVGRLDLLATSAALFGVPWDWSVWNVAERNGQTAVLQWIHDEAATRGSHVPNPDQGRYCAYGRTAAQYCRMDTLTWLDTHGYIFKDPTDWQFKSQQSHLWYGAGQSGSMDTVDHLRGLCEMGSSWNKHVLAGAAAGGHLELVQRLLAEGCPCSFMALSMSVSFNHTAIAAVLLSNGAAVVVDESKEFELEECDGINPCSSAAYNVNLEMLQLLRSYDLPWSCYDIQRMYQIRATGRYNSGPLTNASASILAWALDNGIPLGGNRDAHAAIRHASDCVCLQAIKLLVECYGRRNLPLDINVVVDAVTGENGVERNWHVKASAVVETLQWLHSDMGVAFTLDHMRAAVIHRTSTVITALRQLGCPRDVTVIAGLIAANSRNPGCCAVDRLAERTNILRLLIADGCPLDITVCQKAHDHPESGWARTVLNSMDCPCGHALHQATANDAEE